MATYEPTADPDVVNKVESKGVDLSQYINTYLDLEQQWENRPQLKTVPDQETLDFWNEYRQSEIEITEDVIRMKARELYDDLIPIYEAGLIPGKYYDDLIRLQNFINS